MNIETKEIKTLRTIFPQAKHIFDSINSNQDGSYTVWSYQGLSDFDIEKVLDHGFNLKYISAHLIDKFPYTVISFTKDPDCVNCGQLMRYHNAQAHNKLYCAEEFQNVSTYGSYKTSLLFRAETEAERYKKYGVKYYER